MTTFRRIGIALLALAGLAAPAHALDKVTFATNWVAEPEHGGFYQALADGTYRKYGLDVTIMPGGPNANHRILLPAGKIDFYMAANTLQAFDAVISCNVPTVVVAASFQRTRRSSSPIPTSRPSPISRAGRCSSPRRAWDRISSGSSTTSASTKRR